MAAEGEGALSRSQNLTPNNIQAWADGRGRKPDLHWPRMAILRAGQLGQMASCIVKKVLPRPATPSATTKIPSPSQIAGDQARKPQEQVQALYSVLKGS